MVKRQPSTRLILDTDAEQFDLTSLVAEVNIPRRPDEAAAVWVKLLIDRLEVDENDTLIIHVKED